MRGLPCPVGVINHGLGKNHTPLCSLHNPAQQNILHPWSFLHIPALEIQCLITVLTHPNMMNNIHFICNCPCTLQHSKIYTASFFPYHDPQYIALFLSVPGPLKVSLFDESGSHCSSLPTSDWLLSIVPHQPCPLPAIRTLPSEQHWESSLSALREKMCFSPSGQIKTRFILLGHPLRAQQNMPKVVRGVTCHFLKYATVCRKGVGKRQENCYSDDVRVWVHMHKVTWCLIDKATGKRPRADSPASADK